METLKLKALSLEQQLEYLDSKPLEQQVECIYDIIDKHPKLDDFKTLLMEYKLVLTALKSINEDIINNPINFKDDNHYKRNRIEGIMKHKDLIPLVTRSAARIALGSQEIKN